MRVPMKKWRTLTAMIAAAPLLLGSAALTEGNAANSPALKLITTIPIPVTPQNKAGGMFSFDISYIDKANGLYYLADRSNAAIDVIDTTGAFAGTGKSTGPDTFFGQIGGPASNYKGDTGTTATSGPDGVAAAFPCIFAGDGDSRLLTYNASVSFTTPVSAVNTGGTTRVDEMAFDPADRILLAVNNAETPVFGTLFSISSTCVATIMTKVIFDTAHGVNATNGGEQPAWEPISKRFYVSIPEVNGPGDGTGINGAVAKINPTTGVIEATYQINYCQPAGLTVGPNGDLLVGCNSVFGNDGKKCSAVVPGPSPAGTAAAHPATCTAPAQPQSAICNPGNSCTGNSLVSVQGAGGGDEVWFNSGDGNYYVTAGNDPKGPLFGVVSSTSDTLTQVVPTLPPVPAVAGVHGAGTVHSIAASAANNHVYVPLPVNFDYPNCSTGCVAVFSAQ